MHSTVGDSGYNRSAGGALIGAELVQGVLWLVDLKIKPAFCILCVSSNQLDIIFDDFTS